MMEVVPEAHWQTLITALMKKKGTAMVLGATDSGKSILSKYIITELFGRGVSVSLVDADVGQSSLGIPGTVSMKIFRSRKDIEKFRYDRMSFIGTVNPAMRMSAVVQATRRMAGICGKKSDVVLVDTGGLIGGLVGKAFKLRKIRALRPGHVIALQRGDEMEEILESVDQRIIIHRMGISKMARVRSRQERAAYRQRKLCAYFNRKILRNFSLGAKKITYYADGRADLTKDFFEAGTVIGLNRGADTAALGILSAASRHAVRFLSPIRGVGSITKIIFGDIVLGTIDGSSRR